MDNNLNQALHKSISNQAKLVVLTGAGISAESGIPTFREPEGYWTVGSREYRPEEMATRAMFDRDPDSVWQWYLYRRGVCRKAKPNPGHQALVEMEQHLGDRFLLITQNVDGLHLRAGSSPGRTYQIHGNIDFMRCAAECCRDIYPIPDSVKPKSKDEPLSETDRAALRCPVCEGNARPHVLWFDEFYDEAYYHYNSSIAAAESAGILLSVGTSGATNLPLQVGRVAASCHALLIDVNPNPNPFSKLVAESGGFFLQGAASEKLTEIAECSIFS